MRKIVLALTAALALGAALPVVTSPANAETVIVHRGYDNGWHHGWWWRHHHHDRWWWRHHHRDWW